jgi:hypothetical protein
MNAEEEMKDEKDHPLVRLQLDASGKLIITVDGCKQEQSIDLAYLEQCRADDKGPTSFLFWF